MAEGDEMRNTNMVTYESKKNKMMMAVMPNLRLQNGSPHTNWFVTKRCHQFYKMYPTGISGITVG